MTAADTDDLGVPGMAGRELYAKFLAFISSKYGGRFPVIREVEPFLVVVMEFIESVAAGEPGPRKKEIVLRLVRLAVREHVTPPERATPPRAARRGDARGAGPR